MNSFLFTKFEGFILIGIYAVFIFAVSIIVSGKIKKSKENFLTAGRRLGKWEGAFSIAATWIWAPALFISAQKAYTQGIAGVFWFLVPNVLCLIVFAFFADMIRKRQPDGFTLSGYIRERLSFRVQSLYVLELTGLAVCSFAVQLLAGGKILHAVTGLSYFNITVLLALSALSYSFFSGLKASVVSDYLQMIFIFIVLLIVVPWVFSLGGGVSVLSKGLGGKSGEFFNLFGKESLDVALSFGIPVTIGLMAGPFGDQSFWQRGFAVKKESVKFAFILGAFIFLIVPLSISILGFMAAGIGFESIDPSKVNLEIVMDLLPLWVVIPFIFMLLSGLTSTIDSNLCSISSIAGHDFTGYSHAAEEKAVKNSRISMLVLSFAAVLIANIRGLEILHLFLFYGTLRASTLLPTIIIILKDNVSEKGVFYGILISIVIGLPVFSYGKFTNSLVFIIFGSLFTVLNSGLFTLTFSYIDTYFKGNKIIKTEN